MKVWVTSISNGVGREVYHTDPDCHHLSKSSTVRKVDRDLLYDDLRECVRCSGTGNWERKSGHDSPAKELRSNPDKRKQLLEKISND